MTINLKSCVTTYYEVPNKCHDFPSKVTLLIQIKETNTYTRFGRKVMRLIFYLPKFLFFSNIHVIPFKIVPLGSYTPMKTFPLLVAALEVFNLYDLQHVRYNLLDASHYKELNF